MYPPPLSICRGRDDEHAAERKQRLAVRPARIGSVDELRICVLELAALGLLERRQERREPGRFCVFLDRVLAFENLQVLGLPDVELRGGRRQNIIKKNERSAGR